MNERSPVEAAEARATDLLLSYLSTSQRRNYTNHGFFYVLGSDKRIYAVYNGFIATDVEERMSYGFYFFGYLPHADYLLGQALLISTDAEAMKKMACSLRTPPGARVRRLPRHGDLADQAFDPKLIRAFRKESRAKALRRKALIPSLLRF